MITEITYGLWYALGLLILLVLIRYRRQIFRKQTFSLVSIPFRPPTNNWVFLGLLTLTTLLFLIAIYQGGGEPLGLKALEEISKPKEENQIVKYYSESTRYFVTGSEKPIAIPPQVKKTTWLWWKIAFGSLLLTIIFVPLAFWDEVVRAYHRVQEMIEQRPVRIQLRPAPQPPQPQTAAQSAGTQPQPIPQPARHQSFFTRFKERFWASFSADVITETIFGFIGQIFRQRMAGRR